ncbi:MAG: translation initiation factor IF-2 [Alphaproteobacteria bacterium]|nr:translation initiation factor IF-2 [Alphaproteobacteria bacterium]
MNNDAPRNDDEAAEGDERRAHALASPGRLELKKTVETGQVRQSFSHGRTKSVTVEVKKRRTFKPAAGGAMAEVKAKPIAEAPRAATQAPARPVPPRAQPPADTAAAARPSLVLRALTAEEREARTRAVEQARKADAEARHAAEERARREAEEEVRRAVEREAAARRQADEEARRHSDEESRRKAEEQAARRLDGVEGEAQGDAPKRATTTAATTAPAGAAARRPMEEEADRPRRPGARPEVRRSALAPRRTDDRRRVRITVTQALSDDQRMRSLAAMRRRVEREKRAQAGAALDQQKVVRDVVIPEAITVGELANRMAVRGGELIKALMGMGQMATINHTIDADTAELLVGEFGHRARRVTEADVEAGVKGEADTSEALQPRPPVVTIMGHVDHGKTSLLDALRETDVAAGEAGGITQHIGAYQVTLQGRGTITFLDTPGHEAFTAMRARGAKVTDIVVLVVAVDDGIMPQTVEALNHAKAAGVPMIVAVNKIDLPGANPARVRQELLQHGIVVEEMGGEVLAVNVSAKMKKNLDRLEEAILLQAEVLDLKSNPNRDAEGVVVEARLDRGRGVVATLLVQRGSLKVGDVVVAGKEWGRIRAIADDRGRELDVAGPAVPAEVLGLAGVPAAGDEFAVVENERRAREIVSYRQKRERDARASAGGRGTMEQMFARIQEGGAKELPIVVKADVHGSVEAIEASLAKLATDEVKVRVLHGAVGGINESDITLARASGGMIIGFNVRPNAQARDIAERDGVEIRTYSIIYELIQDLEAMLGGMLAPKRQEKVLGSAQVLQVFTISKVGRIAGCRVTSGVARRNARARLVRDDVVVFDGAIRTLKHVKDDVREVKDNMECGIALENFQDVHEGDRIEFYEVEEVTRTLQDARAS